MNNKKKKTNQYSYLLYTQFNDTLQLISSSTLLTAITAKN